MFRQASSSSFVSYPRKNRKSKPAGPTRSASEPNVSESLKPRPEPGRLLTSPRPFSISIPVPVPQAQPAVSVSFPPPFFRFPLDSKQNTNQMHDRSHKPQPADAGNGGPAGEGGGNVDRVLFKNLVEMVPLVESLMVSNSLRVHRADLAGGLPGFPRCCWPDRCSVLVLPGRRTGGSTRPTRVALRWSTRRRRPRRSVTAFFPPFFPLI